MEHILGTTYQAITVIDAQVSGDGQHIIAALRCRFGKLDTGAVLSSKDGLQWQVTDNDLRFGSEELEQVLRDKEEASIFLYELKGMGHTERPRGGQQLTLVQHPS